MRREENNDGPDDRVYNDGGGSDDFLGDRPGGDDDSPGGGGDRGVVDMDPQRSQTEQIRPSSGMSRNGRPVEEKGHDGSIDSDSVIFEENLKNRG